MLIMWVQTVEGKVGVLGIVAKVVEVSNDGGVVQVCKECSKSSGRRWAGVEGCVGGYGHKRKKSTKNGYREESERSSKTSQPAS